MPALKLAPGETKTDSMRLYAGPQEQEKLKELAPGLEHVVDYGWLTILAYPIFVHAQLAGKPGAQLGRGHHSADRC
jgi:YidC/Oxa1 family membrane protein insertase